MANDKDSSWEYWPPKVRSLQKKLTQAFIKSQIFFFFPSEYEEKKKKSTNVCKLHLSGAAHLFQMTGLGCEHMCEWMSALVFLHEKPKRVHIWNQSFNPLRKLYYRSHMMYVCETSWEGKVQGQSVLAKDCLSGKQLSWHRHMPGHHGQWPLSHSLKNIKASVLILLWSREMPLYYIADWTDKLIKTIILLRLSSEINVKCEKWAAVRPEIRASYAVVDAITQLPYHKGIKSGKHWTKKVVWSCKKPKVSCAVIFSLTVITNNFYNYYHSWSLGSYKKKKAQINRTWLNLDEL